MLLNFTVSNWMSYRDEATLALTASRERQHGETLAAIPGFRSKKALPVAAVYGGNSSGKTGVFKGLLALKGMVVGDVGVKGSLPADPFRLDEACLLAPTLFDATFLAGETVYRLVVETLHGSVSYESLEVVGEKGAAEVYERDGGATRCNPARFADPGHAAYAAKSTRPNQLFLGSAVAHNIAELAEAYSWFADTLQLVGVESNARSFATAVGSRGGFLDYAGAALARLDTGIDSLAGEPVDLASLPDGDFVRRSLDGVGPGETAVVVTEKGAGDYGFEMLTARPGKDGPEVQRLRTVHVGADGRARTFGLGMESSGTQRLMGLLPMLFDLAGPGASKVYVVDELDRCLHTMLTAQLVRDFLATCGPRTRKQLLFTTHDLLLMDQSIMRRDEMYVAQRGPGGRSELVGLAEYEGIRYDKDLVRSYLDGRFGGIPMLGGVGPRGQED